MSNPGESVVVDIQSPSDDRHSNANVAECPNCHEAKPLRDWVPSRWYSPFGRHRCCQDCRNRRIAEFVQKRHYVDLPCFKRGCDDKLTSDLVREELRRFQPHLLATYKDKLVKSYLLTTKDVIWCPGPKCNFAAIYTDIDKCPTLQCPVEGCNTLICPKCKGKAHEGADCPPPLQLEGVKTCPNCSAKVQRIEASRDMTCAVCKQKFCWDCGQAGWTHPHELKWNWPTHPCLKWPLHVCLIVTFFFWGFLSGLMMGLMMLPIWIIGGRGRPHLFLRILMFIGFPIVGVGMAFSEAIKALNYHYACEQIEEIWLMPEGEFAFVDARRLEVPS